MSSSPLDGFATPEGTAAFASAAGVARTHFRTWRGLSLSSFGLGTYLGGETTSDDRRMEAATTAALAGGVNVLDSAINYRAMRSERSIGRALAAFAERDPAARSKVFVSTKGGFLTHDSEATLPPREWFSRTYVESGILGPRDVSAGVHSMAPAYLESVLAQSRRNLGVRGVDLYYVHNPESQLADTPRDVFRTRLLAAFKALERAADAGHLATYGVATWNAFRVPPQARDHLELEDLVDVAQEAAGDRAPRFGAIQLPVSFAMPEALLARTQTVGGEPCTILEAAERLDIAVFASASIGQARTLDRLPPVLRDTLGTATPATAALQFTRSAPGVLSALVGMKRPEHLEENLALAAAAPAPVETVRELIERMRKL